MIKNRFWRSLGIGSLIFIKGLIGHEIRIFIESLIGLAVIVCIAGIAFSPSGAYAEVSRRSLELELDDVPGSTGFEIRVTRILADKTKKPPIVFKISGSKWSAKLVPGKYTMEERSFDSRHVPGAWSDPQEFVVKLPAVDPTSPEINASIKAEDEKNEKMTFTWNPIEGADKYKLKILNEDGTVVQESIEKDTSVKVKLPVGKQYKWGVTAVMDDGVEGEESASGSRLFEIVGGKLDKPKIMPVDDVNTTDFNWVTPPFASKFKYKLEYQEKNGEWKPFDAKDIKISHRAFKNPIPSGKYRVTVVAQADRRLDSDPSIVEFKTTFLNSRSPAAVEQVKSEGSYETKSPIFALASYYVAFVNYQGSNSDTSNYRTSFNAIGGTGRLGIGTWFSEDSKIGILTTADLSGFSFQNSDGSTSNPLYYTQSLQGVYRQRLGGLGQLRINFGGEYRSLPVALSSNPSAQTSYESVLITIDPLIGFTLSHGFTRKLGAQLSLQVADSLFSVTTPTSQANIPTISTEASLLGSLKLSQNLVGFMGIAFRDEKGSYQINPATSSATGSNTSEVSGTYVNLLLEYGF